jgi:hypothetical protein
MHIAVLDPDVAPPRRPLLIQRQRPRGRIARRTVGRPNGVIGERQLATACPLHRQAVVERSAAADFGANRPSRSDVGESQGQTVISSSTVFTLFGGGVDGIGIVTYLRDP